MTVAKDLSFQGNTLKEKALDSFLLWLGDILEQPVKSTDNFLDIGGHSMIAISLNERIKKEFGLTLSMERLYNATLEEVFSNAK